jgi:hypothetical protein
MELTFEYKLPILYSKANARERRAVREQYVKQQNNLCMFCNTSLDLQPPKEIKSKKINWKLFPPGFLKNPIHLQHDHSSDLTEGAVHAYCNAVMWQYHRR